jgi:hypothetical protein
MIVRSVKRHLLLIRIGLALYQKVCHLVIIKFKERYVEVHRRIGLLLPVEIINHSRDQS